MADEEHVALLKQGVKVWNKWREENPGKWANLCGADLHEAVLTGADLHKADLTRVDLLGADLLGADLSRVNLSGADLSRAFLYNAHLHAADLTGADLSGAHLLGAYLYDANLSGADLRGANLTHTVLIGTNLTNANLAGCRIYGISAWDLKLEGTTQENLIITDHDQAEITVDNIEVAQFIYLLLHNEKIRDVIDTLGKKGVLLLGRFTGGRITILDKLREELRERGFVPIVFNFERPEKSDFTETIRTLAGLCRFIIADITNPRSTPLELQAVVPEYMVPFVPIIEGGEEPFAMFKDLWVKHSAWVFGGF
jgi:hypothetical protein